MATVETPSATSHSYLLPADPDRYNYDQWFQPSLKNYPVPTNIQDLFKHFTAHAICHGSCLIADEPVYDPSDPKKTIYDKDVFERLFSEKAFVVDQQRKIGIQQFLLDHPDYMTIPAYSDGGLNRFYPSLESRQKVVEMIETGDGPQLLKFLSSCSSYPNLLRAYSCMAIPRQSEESTSAVTTTSPTAELPPTIVVGWPRKTYCDSLLLRICQRISYPRSVWLNDGLVRAFVHAAILLIPYADEDQLRTIKAVVSHGVRQMILHEALTVHRTSPSIPVVTPGVWFSAGLTSGIFYQNEIAMASNDYLNNLFLSSTSLPTLAWVSSLMTPKQRLDFWSGPSSIRGDESRLESLGRTTDEKRLRDFIATFPELLTLECPSLAKIVCEAGHPSVMRAFVESGGDVTKIINDLEEEIDDLLKEVERHRDHSSRETTGGGGYHRLNVNVSTNEEDDLSHKQRLVGKLQWYMICHLQSRVKQLEHDLAEVISREV